MKRLQIRQLQSELYYLNCYEFKLIDLTDNSTILSDSIDDTGQGMDEATNQIHEILRRKELIN